VVRLLHRGSRSDVYEAWSAERLCNVVVKLPRPEHLGDRDVAQRTIAEGHVLSRLSHPHLVRCYELVEAMPAVVLERLPGMTLHTMVHSVGKLVEWPDIVRWSFQLATALQYMHRYGVLHLDLKPGNVMVDERGATLIDLHLARAAGTVPHMLGTPGYRAPEIADSGIAGPASDVWGLGAVLYELAAASKAIGDADEPNYDVPSIATVRTLPATLASVIDSCLHCDPARRPTLEQLLIQLQA
jgi:serine/threonine protein kinase